MSGNTTKNDFNKVVSFIQHDLPGIPAGTYHLEVEQEVTKANGQSVMSPIKRTFDFAVMGDRFRLTKPTQSIYAVYPPADAAGKYDTVLPHVVFTNTSLPWSRQLKKKEQAIASNIDKPTWLTVLLLDEDDVDVASFSKLSLKTKQLTIQDLFTSALPENYVSYFENIAPTEALDAGEQLSDTIEVLDIPMGLFQKLAPSIDDLKVMAHVRKVSLLNKPTMPGISDKGEPEGSFSIVFGNRLPQSLKKTTAYLVSLEGIGEYLPTNAGNPKQGVDPKKILRLAVLKSWSFSSNGQSATFADRMQRLNGGTPTSAEQAINEHQNLSTTLTLPTSEKALPVVKQVLNMGYVPLNHELRSVDVPKNVSKKKEIKPSDLTVNKTVSWYRGPLIPYEIKENSIRLPISSPDKVTVYDPTMGMFDTSYAAAWSLGRLLALQNKAFSTALYVWKKGLTQDILNRVENNLLATNIGQAFINMSATASRSTKKSRSLSPPKEELELPPLKGKLQSGDLMRRAILMAMKKE